MNSDTLIICGVCEERIPRTSMTCPKCGASLSSSQLRATVEKAAGPSGWLELAEERVKWLEALHPTWERRRLMKLGQEFAAEFAAWQEGGLKLPTPIERAPRVQAFSNWCSLVQAERKKG
jgi:hypothetical protein